jgi:CRP-like cAMP-binding protein
MTIDTQEIEHIRHTYLFSELADDEWQRVAGRATARHLRAGQPLFAQGAPCSHFFLLQQGRVKLYRLSSAGEEKVIDIIGPGQLFAEAVMFMGARFPVHAEALEATRLIAFDAKDFNGLARGNADLCFRLLSAMSQRMHGLVNEIARLTLQSGTERLVQYLLDQLPDDEPGSSRVRLQVPKQVIASRVGVQPETLSRILAKLRKSGLLEMHDDTITLRDVSALRRLTLE